MTREVNAEKVIQAIIEHTDWWDEFHGVIPDDATKLQCATRDAGAYIAKLGPLLHEPLTPVSLLRAQAAVGGPVDPEGRLAREAADALQADACYLDPYGLVDNVQDILFDKIERTEGMLVMDVLETGPHFIFQY